MTKTLFYILTIAGALALTFGAQPLFERMNVKLEDDIQEKLTGALVALYLCITAFIYITSAQ
jgi:hypothetical protein